MTTSITGISSSSAARVAMPGTRSSAPMKPSTKPAANTQAKSTDPAFRMVSLASSIADPASAAHAQGKSVIQEGRLP